MCSTSRGFYATSTSSYTETIWMQSHHLNINHPETGAHLRLIVLETLKCFKPVIYDEYAWIGVKTHLLIRVNMVVQTLCDISSCTQWQDMRLCRCCSAHSLQSYSLITGEPFVQKFKYSEKALVPPCSVSFISVKLLQRRPHLLPVNSQFSLEGVPVSLGGLLWDEHMLGAKFVCFVPCTKLQVSGFPYLVDVFVFFSADNLLDDLSLSSHQSRVQ